MRTLLIATAFALTAAALASTATAATTYTVAINSSPTLALGKVIDGTVTTSFTIPTSGLVTQNPVSGSPGAAILVKPLGVTGTPIQATITCNSTAGQGCASGIMATVHLTGTPTANPHFNTTSFSVTPISNMSNTTPTSGIASGGTFTFKFTNSQGSPNKTNTAQFEIGTVVSLGGGTGTGNAAWTITIGPGS